MSPLSAKSLEYLLWGVGTDLRGIIATGSFFRRSEYAQPPDGDDELKLNLTHRTRVAHALGEAAATKSSVLKQSDLSAVTAGCHHLHGPVAMIPVSAITNSVRGLSVRNCRCAL
jgi:hypothetical protein